MDEIWKDVVGYEGLYRVSNMGRVISLPKLKKTPTTTFYTKERFANASFSKGGYLRVSLSKNGKAKRVFLHRIVANAFLGVNDKMTINHIDEDKTNNKAENLEYMTLSDNIRYGGGTKRSSLSRKKSDKVRKTPVNQYSLEGVFIRRYKSINEAKELNGFKKENISLCCCRKRNQSNGFIWRYDGDKDVSYHKNNNAKTVIQYDLNGERINEYSSAKEASIHTKTSRKDISNCCNGHLKKANGYIWKFKL